MDSISHISAALTKEISRQMLYKLQEIRSVVNAYKVTVVIDAVVGNIAIFDSDGMVEDSGKALPDGDIVGTIDEQTLENKTIDADDNEFTNFEHGAEVDNPSSHVHGVAGNIVGDTDIQTLFNKTLITPIIADLSNMQHDHTTPAEGGLLETTGILEVQVFSS